jgi:hypothetical protein
MFERLSKPIIPINAFYKRLGFHIVFAFIILVISLLIGVGGYMYFAKMTFVDALLNASMILGGMGPVDILHNDSAKYFASFYAIYSGAAFLIIFAVVLSPIVHRFLHKFHIE